MCTRAAHTHSTSCCAARTHAPARDTHTHIHTHTGCARDLSPYLHIVYTHTHTEHSTPRRRRRRPTSAAHEARERARNFRGQRVSSRSTAGCVRECELFANACAHGAASVTSGAARHARWRGPESQGTTAALTSVPQSTGSRLLSTYKP